MSLRVWLPLGGDLKNQGLDTSVTPTLSNTFLEGPGKISQKSLQIASGRYLTIPYIPNNEHLSIALWIKPNSPSAWCNIFSFGGASLNRAEKGETSNKIYYWFSENPSLIQSGTQIFSLADETNWFHLIMTADGSQVKFYINGQLKSTSTQLNTISTVIDSGYVLFGARSVSGNQPYASYMNDVRIYDHALTEAEIKLLAQGLVAHYPLKAPFLPNLLQGAEQYTKENPLVRYADVNESNSLQDSYVYHEEITVNIRRPGRYIFVLNSDGTQAGHKQDDSTNTIENRKYMIRFRGASGYPIWTEFSIAKDGRYYGFLDFSAAGVHDLRTNLYIYSNVGNYTVNFWDMQLFECDQYIPEMFEPVSFRHLPNSVKERLQIDNPFTQDTSGYGHRAELEGTMEAAGYAPTYSNCGYFDGSSYLKCGKTPKINGDAITVSCWGYMDDWAGYAGKRLASCTEGGGWNFESRSDSAAGEFCFAIAIDKPSGANPYTYYNVYDQRVLEDKTTKMGVKDFSAGWHHFCGTFDGLVSRLYIDGVEVGTTDYLTEKYSMYYNSSNGVFIGAEAQSSDTTAQAGTMFNGLISDVRIYATALSAEVIQEMAGSNRILTDGKKYYSNEFIETNHILSQHSAYSGNFTELNAPISNMKIKTLPDRTTWARIHSLDLTEQKNAFQNNEEANDCDVFGKYSKMGLVDEFKKNSLNNYEFMLTYPSINITLPSGYTQLEYVESDGRQWLNTNVSELARWEFDIQFQTGISHRQLMGYNGNYQEYWGVQAHGGYGIHEDKELIGINAGKRDTIVHCFGEDGKYYLQLQDKTLINSNSNIGTSNYQLFSIISSAGYACHTKLYRCNCIKDKKLIRQFIPALRISDNVAGLYDLVNKQFYTSNSGTHLLAGPVLTTGPKVIEYIESTDEQYIDTGITYDNSAKYDVYLDLSYSAMLEDYQIMGFTGNRGMGVGPAPASNGDWWEANQGASLKPTINTRYNIHWYKEGANYSRVINSTNVSSGTDGNTGTVASGLLLFAAHRSYDNLTPDYFCQAKLYSAKIYCDNILVRDFIPIVSGQGEAGLFDLVEKQFYTNQGSGKFVTHEAPLQKIEYISATGTQHIDTNFIPNHNTSIEIEFEYGGSKTGNGTTGDVESLFGARTATTSNVFAMWLSKTNVFPHYGNSVYTDKGSFSENGKEITKRRSVYKYEKNIAYYNDNSINCDIPSGGFSSGNNLCLLAMNTNGTIDKRKAIGKLYGCKIWDDNTLIRNFIPVINSNGEACLYDLVQHKYYTNSGSGVFDAGPMIQEPINQYNRWIQTNSPNVNYRQSTGYQPIHTDFYRWNGSKYSSGPITKNFDQERSTYLVSESNDPWAPIGSKELYGTGIRALNNTTQLQAELWVRIDKMPEATSVDQSDGCYIAPQFIEY